MELIGTELGYMVFENRLNDIVLKQMFTFIKNKKKHNGNN